MKSIIVLIKTFPLSELVRLTKILSVAGRSGFSTDHLFKVANMAMWTTKQGAIGYAVARLYFTIKVELSCIFSIVYLVFSLVVICLGLAWISPLPVA